MDNELLSTIWLTLVYGTASPHIHETIRKYGSAEKAYEAVKDSSSGEQPSMTPAQLKNLKKYDLTAAEKIAESCLKSDITILTESDSRYPKRLKNIEIPPALLYCQGDISELSDALSISVVGARNPSQYSMKAAAAISKELAMCGFHVASGFAVGIDIISHISAVSAGGKTYAVIGCGHNYNYPYQNIPYRQHIINHGAVISEYPPDHRPSPYTFPQRNRILSGISAGTLVVEAAAKSGSLVTANHANDQGRSLFALVPNDIFDTRYSGNVSLIRDGAVPVMGIKDILYEYYPEYKDKLTARAEEIYLSGYIFNDVYKPVSKASADRPTASEADMQNKAAKADKPAKPKESNVKTPTEPDSRLSELPENQKLIADIISKADHPVLADEIADEAGIPISEILSILTDMEIDGIVTGGAGNTYYM